MPKETKTKPTPRRNKPRYLAQIEAWRKKNTTSFSIRLNKISQSHIIAKLNSQPNKTEYIANLIEEDIKHGS